MSKKQHHAIGSASQLMKHNGKYASYDPAETTKTDDKIRNLLEKHATELTNNEHEFVISIYGEGKLTRRQHIWLTNIIKKQN